MYIRFESRDGTGLFAEAGSFRAEMGARRVPRWARREFVENYDWLSWHTPAPPEEAYVDTRARYPLTWFKQEARGHIARAWRIANILGRHGVHMRPIVSDDPGLILFEDEVQVVVRPKRESIRPAARPPNIQAPGSGWSGSRDTIRRGGWRG